MAVHLKGRSLDSLLHLTKEEIEQILKTSELLKLQLLRGEKRLRLRDVCESLQRHDAIQLRREAQPDGVLHRHAEQELLSLHELLGGPGQRQHRPLQLDHA